MTNKTELIGNLMNLTVQTRTGNKFLRKLYRQRYLFLMLLPAILLIITFSYVPLLGWVIAFKNYQVGISVFKVPWTGWYQFQSFFQDSADYLNLLRNTLVMNFSVIIVNLTCGLIFAILLSEVSQRVFKKAVQTISFFPFFISWVIVYAIVFDLFGSSTGAVNITLTKHGILKHGIDVLGNPAYSWVLIIFLEAWKYIGYNAVIFIAGISGIPNDEFEAASIDGANRFDKIWHVTLPNLMPTLIILMIINIGFVLNSDFELFYLFTNPLNINTMQVFDMYIYKYGIQQGNFSYATAIGMIKTIVSIALLLSANFVAKRATGKSFL